MKLLQFKKDQLPSVIKDPFAFEYLAGFSIRCYKNYKGMFVFKGTIQFQVGATSGEQDFEAKDFKSLLIKMQQVVEEVGG